MQVRFTSFIGANTISYCIMCVKNPTLLNNVTDPDFTLSIGISRDVQENIW